MAPWWQKQPSFTTSPVKKFKQVSGKVPSLYERFNYAPSSVKNTSASSRANRMQANPSSGTAAAGHHVEIARPSGSIEVRRYGSGSLSTPAPIPNTLGRRPILQSKVDQELDKLFGVSISDEDTPPGPETPMGQRVSRVSLRKKKNSSQVGESQCLASLAKRRNSVCC